MLTDFDVVLTALPQVKMIFMQRLAKRSMNDGQTDGAMISKEV
jgi:hypothetical protein